jgi:hypothetical protein
MAQRDQHTDAAALVTRLQQAVNAHTVWSEWEHVGTRRDGSRHVMRGVVIFGVVGNSAAWARFHLEPVEEGGADVNEDVRRQVAAAGPHASGSGRSPQ